MKRWLKNTLVSVTCIALIGFVVGFSTNWSSQTTITSVGSSGVKPFIESLSKDYIKSHKDIDITVDAGGSGFGIEQVANGYTNIGNASKDPYSSVNDPKNELLTKWEDKRIKTYTVAWEAICLVYIPPKSLQNDSGLFPTEDNKPLLSVSSDTINELYQAFSGYKGSEYYSNARPKLGDFASYYVDSSTKDILNSINITPYVRTGGSLTSGTAASFYEYSRYSNARQGLDERTNKAFTVGNYGSDWKIVQTDEANSRAWDMFSKSNIPGSVVYLSSGFIAKNEKLIRDKHYGVFGYQKEGTTTVFPYSTENMSDSKYKWCRPLNLITSLDSSGKEKQFIEDFLLNGGLEVEAKWRQMGAAPLNDWQKESMTEDGSYNVSDIEKGNDFYGAAYE